MENSPLASVHSDAVSKLQEEKFSFVVFTVLWLHLQHLITCHCGLKCFLIYCTVFVAHFGLTGRWLARNLWTWDLPADVISMHQLTYRWVIHPPSCQNLHEYILKLSRYQNFKLQYNINKKKIKKRYSITLSVPWQKEKRHTSAHKIDLEYIFVI